MDKKKVAIAVGTSAVLISSAFGVSSAIDELKSEDKFLDKVEIKEISSASLSDKINSNDKKLEELNKNKQGTVSYSQLGC